MFILSHGIIVIATVPHKKLKEVLMAAVGAMFPDIFAAGAGIFYGCFLYFCASASFLYATEAAGHYVDTSLLCKQMEVMSHSFLVCAGMCILTRKFFRTSSLGDMFFYGWTTYLVIDIFSHGAPHYYLWPLPFGIPWIDVWHHSSFWRHVLGSATAGAFVESGIVAVVLLPVFFTLRRHLSR